MYSGWGVLLTKDCADFARFYYHVIIKIVSEPHAFQERLKSGLQNPNGALHTHVGTTEFCIELSVCRALCLADSRVQALSVTEWN